MRKRMTHAERREETRENLLASALEVFVERGYHAATLELVAESAGYSKGAVYSQFDSKADLFFALLERRVAHRITAIEADGAAATSPESLALAQVRRWMQGIRDDPGWSLLMAEFRIYVVRHPELLQRYRGLHGCLRDAVARSIRTEFESAGLELPVPAEDMARCAMAGATGALMERLAEGEAFGDALAERMGVAIMRDFLPDTAPAATARPAPKAAARSRRKAP